MPRNPAGCALACARWPRFIRRRCHGARSSCAAPTAWPPPATSIWGGSISATHGPRPTGAGCREKAAWRSPTRPRSKRPKTPGASAPRSSSGCAASRRHSAAPKPSSSKTSSTRARRARAWSTLSIWPRACASPASKRLASGPEECLSGGRFSRHQQAAPMWQCRRHFAQLGAAAIVACLGSAPALAAEAAPWPSRPITLVVPFPPGGMTDVGPRRMAKDLQHALGQSVVVDNRAGASGQIGTEHVHRAAPDGYTLLVSATHHVINPALRGKLPYDARSGFTPLALLASTPNVLVVHKDVPAANLSEFIAYARKQPGGSMFGSSSIGGATHLSGELLRLEAGIPMTHVPYKGAAPALADLLAGQIPALFHDVMTMAPYVRDGRVKALVSRHGSDVVGCAQPSERSARRIARPIPSVLASDATPRCASMASADRQMIGDATLGVTSATRSGALPEVPTIAEQGLPGYQAITWTGSYGPAHRPSAIAERRSALARASVNSAAARPWFKDNGADPGDMDQKQYAAFVASELGKWKNTVARAGVSVD